MEMKWKTIRWLVLYTPSGFSIISTRSKRVYIRTFFILSVGCSALELILMNLRRKFKHSGILASVETDFINLIKK